MCFYISLMCFYILKDFVGQSFEILQGYEPYISLNQSSTYNYGYWFKFQPLTKLKLQRRFGNSNNYFYGEYNQYLLSFELSDNNTLSLWHIQTDKFDHIINILQTDGMKSYLFRPDLLDYEGRWNFFGIQMISDNQYQIIFFMNQLEVIIINGQIQRKQEQDYYIGGYGDFQKADGSQIYYGYFKGQITNFIELDEIVNQNNFYDIVFSDQQSYLNSLQPKRRYYFDILILDGQSAKKYQQLSYREGIRYVISMWVKSSIKQYLQPLNYSIFIASLSDKLTDNYLGDNQLFIQYQVGKVPKDNIVYAMTYSFQSPVYKFQQKNLSDWIKIQDYDFMLRLKQWHFIQFEYGRTSQPETSPPKYNSLFTLILPGQNEQFNQDWNRDNHHFTGVPIYFYLGGALSKHENKFIGSISQFTFISYNTIDMQATIQCHFTCLTCKGPTSLDCLTCSQDKNRLFFLNQCICQMGYMNNVYQLDQQCIQKYQMIEFVETEYICPEGYDQCEDKIVCSFGYFSYGESCYKCPQQPQEQLQDIIFCVECVLNPNSWGYRDLSCKSNIFQLDSPIFIQNYRDIYNYRYQSNDDFLEINSIEYDHSWGCEKEYGLDDYSLKCKKCQICLNCAYQQDIQICLECPSSYYLYEKDCIKCGINCVKCDSKGCLECQEGSFLTLDKINCNQCLIQNCAYCYQYYQNQTSNQITISLDLKFNQLDLSLDGITTSCARCNYGFAIQGDICIEYSIQSCLTGIMDNGQFQCLIAQDQSTGLQYDNCDLVENCFSCFVNYPINPWCIQCLDGYYVQFEDGSCIACPDICASCLRQNSALNDSWKINIRAFYYYKFDSHLFEDYAIDSDNYQYNIVCTACKDDNIIYENTCIPGCKQDCEVCEYKEGKARCVKCRDNQYGPILSLDANSQCLQCPQNCKACTPRRLLETEMLNKYFESEITSNEHQCILQEKDSFMDNEFNLPVKCENSQKCFKSLILQLDVYCNSNFNENITNCKLNTIQLCLENIFNLQMIDYIKRQVIKELEIILNIKDQICQLNIVTVTQFITKDVLSLKNTTLKLRSQNQTILNIRYLNLFNFDNYIISNIFIQNNMDFNFQIIGQSQINITLEQITLQLQMQRDNYFTFINVRSLILKDVIIKENQQGEQFIFTIQNQDIKNIYVLITGLQIMNQSGASRFFNITSTQGGQIDLILTNISIVNSKFENESQFIVSNGLQIKAIIWNLTIENNIFKDSQFLKFENVIEKPQFQVSVNNNNLTNSTLIQIPIINIENSIFIDNKLQNESILIKSIGSFSNFSGQFIFQHLLIQQNEYCYGCQFISINNQYQKNISVYFKNYSSINNQQGDFLIMKLNQQSLIYINTNYVFINTFFIERLNGTIELSIMQTQRIEIQNLTIQNNVINKIITKQKLCLSNSQNLVLYILDTQYISIDKFIINQLSVIDYSIIAIQSQSILKKEQNETIILKNGQILNNSLVVSQLNKQISVIQINSQQYQQIYINDLNFVKNILNVYVQDQQMFSASTLLIQSDKGQVYLQNLKFQQNFAINSINSQLRIQSNFIQIRDTMFLYNNMFNFEVLKNFLILNYYDLIYIETIQFDFPIVSNGGSGQFIASTIIIENINIQGSFGANGGAFFIQTLGESNIKISNFFSLQSYTLPDTTSQGGTFYIDGSKSNLQLIIENVSIQYSKSRKNGGFIYLNALQLTSQINNVSCTNCFSINGGFIIVDSTDFYPPYITLKNIKIQNPDFRWFLGNINDMTIEEQIIFRKNSYLLYLPNSILKVYQLQITDGDLSGILYVDGKNGIIINKMIIQQYRAFLTPLVTISHSQITKKQVYLADIQIKDINQGSSKQYVCNNGLYEKQMETFNAYENCSKEELIKIQEIFILFDDHYIKNTFNCNYEWIHQNSEESVAIIQVFNLSKNLINIENMNINNISYQAAYGLFSLRDFSQIANQVKINNLNIINSCMLVSSSTSDLINKKRLLVNNMQEIIKSQNSSVNIYNSKFINNQAIQGSGIYIQNVTVMIINTVFINNKAQTQGGAVYSSSIINNLLLLNNQIINNSGANQTGSAVQLNNITMSKLDGFQNIFFDNQQDLHEIPQGLQILIGNVILSKNTIKNDSQVLIEQVYVKPYKLLGYKQLTDVITLPSGQSIKDYQYFDQFSQQYISYNLSLRFIPINRFRQQQYDQQLDLQLKARNDNSNYSNKYFDQDVFVYDNKTQSFNLDDLKIYYSPYESNNLQVNVKSPGIKIPKYSSTPPYNIQSYQNYELRFKIKTFQCQLGQFFNVITQSCEQCLGNTYSVQLNSRICVFKDDNFINEVNSAMIQLKPGYWRAYVFSPQIDSCYHLKENCIGGWGTGNQLCSLGHIGALCEQCDLYNIRGNGSYSVSSLYSCGSCSAVTGNIISVILISVWTLISIVMSVQSTIEYIDDHIRRSKFIKLGLTLQDQKINPAIVIKVLSNYLQIIATITTFQLQVPPGIASVFNSVGNPINQMAYSLDCFLTDLTKINIIYFRIIWSVVIAFSYILIYLIGYFILVFTKKAIFNLSAVTTCFIYLYVYLQPNLISSLIQLVSYRNISGQSWIAGNVSYKYNTKTHTIWLLCFVIPLLFVIGVIIPIILWFGIFKNRKNLNDNKAKSIWGYLYNEYRQSSYYWETIKISQKEFIIIVLAYYEDYIPIKAALVFICLFFYSQFTNIKQPYNQGVFNQLDAQQTTICAVSIILATTIYTAQQYNLLEIIWPFYLIISILNIYFVLKLLGILIYAYGQAFETQLDQIRDTITFRYPELMNKNHFLKKILENQEHRKKRINLRFMQIKNYLLPKAQLIIQFKKQNNMIIQSKLQQPSYIRQTQLNEEINSPQTQNMRLNIQ